MTLIGICTVRCCYLTRANTDASILVHVSTLTDVNPYKYIGFKFANGRRLVSNDGVLRHLTEGRSVSAMYYNPFAKFAVVWSVRASACAFRRIRCARQARAGCSHARMLARPHARTKLSVTISTHVQMRDGALCVVSATGWFYFHVNAGFCVCLVANAPVSAGPKRCSYCLRLIINACTSICIHCIYSAPCQS